MTATATAPALLRRKYHFYVKDAHEIDIERICRELREDAATTGEPAPTAFVITSKRIGDHLLAVDSVLLDKLEQSSESEIGGTAAETFRDQNWRTSMPKTTGVTIRDLSDNPLLKALG